MATVCRYIVETKVMTKNPKTISPEALVVDAINVESAKTKDMKAILKDLNINNKVLIVVDELNENLILSSRNLNNVLLLSVDEINTYDVVYADTMLITEKALKEIEEVLK